MDKFRDECGVFGIFGHTEAANLTYLGLYALQHRGQESAGIACADGNRVQLSRAMGEVNDSFDQAKLAALVGEIAIGHVRYSTAGSSRIENAQPMVIECAHGHFGIGHNGNLVNASELRDDLVRQGAIFQSTSDTEVIIHLVATSRYPTLLDRFVDALRMVEGAYSLICMRVHRRAYAAASRVRQCSMPYAPDFTWA